VKKDVYTDIICKGFCTFYNSGNEKLICGTYDFIFRNLTPGELESAILGIASTPDFTCDRKIQGLICEKCGFVIDGCDFREGMDAPPCGGYTIIEWLIKKGLRKSHSAGEVKGCYHLSGL
jgi:hypothetical protein